MSCDAAVESVLTADVCVVVDGSSDDEDGDSFDGPKHWHVFHVIAQRPELR